MNKSIFILLLLLINSVSFSQNYYWVFLNDKSNTEFNPYQYFDNKAIERRIKQNLPLSDSTDYPINSYYIQEIANYDLTIHSETRWFNALCVICSENTIIKISQLPFVKDISKIITDYVPAKSKKVLSNPKYKKELLQKQIKRMQGNMFHNTNITGKGVRIAVFDTGFPYILKNSAYKHIVDSNRIIATYDFARKRENVYGHQEHGSQVLSCITGISKNGRIGMATESEFLLARTEVKGEPKSEEANWLAAVEWADKNGADIINSSLGYTFHRYFPEQMDGKTSLVVKAANLAARKGMLVINSMGNDGELDWKVLCTPADGDSVLAIGGIDPKTDYHIGFSSFGPTHDKRLKPNLCAYGEVVAVNRNGLEIIDGTSFSAPLITGFAACVWQLYPNFTNMELFSELEKSGDLYPYFDYAHGYGVPQASYFIRKDFIEPIEETFDYEIKNDKLRITVYKKFISKTIKENNYLYYHIENENHFLDKYSVIDVFKEEALVLPIDDIDDDSIIRVFYKGYTAIIKLD